MPRARVIRRAAACTTGALALVVAAGVLAQGTGSQVFRYEDAQGRGISTHKAPASDTVPLATQQAADRFPVTLYTFACGEICQSAEGLLNKRGVPFTAVNVE